LSDAQRQQSSPDVPQPFAAVAHVPGAIAGTAVVERPLPPAFDGLALHNKSELVCAEPPTVSGSVPGGGYLASLDRTERRGSDGFEALQVRLRVLEGAVGVGLLDAAGTRFLDVVDGFEPDRVTELTFVVYGIAHAGALVVRNAGDRRATFEWLGADSFQLKNVSNIVEGTGFPDELAPVPGWNRYYGRFGATPVEGVRQILFDRLREPFAMPWRHGLQVTITPGEETSRVLFVSGAYEPASMLAVQRFLFPGAVFFDIGANVGVFTLVSSRLVGAAGHVYSFEPSSRERSTLQSNLAINGCRNVSVIAAAVSDRSGDGSLRIAAGQFRGQNTLASSFGFPGVQLAGVESVPLVSLDELWQERRLRRPDVVKIDAEGHELRVLRGALGLMRDAMPVVVFEINDTLLQASGASRDAVEAVFRGLGYSLFRPDERTASLVEVASLRGVQAENFFALPPARIASGSPV
jgi:FkbM family methyltransferase